jgi:hypothetical protein
MALPPSAHDPQAVRDLADRILAGSRYDRPAKSVPDRILEWFAHQLGRVLGSLVGGGAGAVLAWALVLGALAAFVYLVVRFGRVPLPPHPPGRPPEVMVELSRSGAQWRAEAADLEARGLWREGLRARHRALIADLVRDEVLPDRAGRTAREQLAAVTVARPGAGPAMAAATELFEAAWYGGMATGEAEAARFRSLEDEVLGRATASAP